MNPTPAESDADVLAPTRLLRFRLIHVIYVISLLSMSLATFGAGGLLLWVIVCVFWGMIFTSRSRPKVFLEAFLVALLCSCLICVGLPAVFHPREVGRRMSCANNLKQIGLAMHNYHDHYGSFPPAYLPDENGQPKHSWRVLLLPFLEQQPMYDAYDFDEPWDGPNNSKFLDSMPRVYACPSSRNHTFRPRTYTSYVAVVGPATVWPGDASCKLSDISDGTAKTVLVTEIGGHNIPWLQPRDLEFDEALELLVAGEDETTGNHVIETFFYRFFSGRNMALADGAVRYVDHGVDRKVWSALLDKDDGVAWEDADLEAHPERNKKLRFGNILRVTLLIALTLFPLPWVWLNPTSGITASLAIDANKV